MVIDRLRPDLDPPANDGRGVPYYLLLADISGYTAFLSRVESTHQVDLSGVMPAGYEILGQLLEAVVGGIQPAFAVEQIEGDAVFASAAADALDGQGEATLALLRTAYDAFSERREHAKATTDHICTACPLVGTLELKYILHRGTAIRLRTRVHSDLHSPAVNVVHRLLKNDIRERIDYQPYIFCTEQAAASLGLSGGGLQHDEIYADVGTISGEIFTIAKTATRSPSSSRPPPANV